MSRIVGPWLDVLEAEHAKGAHLPSHGDTSDGLASLVARADGVIDGRLQVWIRCRDGLPINDRWRGALRLGRVTLGAGWDQVIWYDEDHVDHMGDEDDAPPDDVEVFCLRVCIYDYVDRVVGASATDAWLDALDEARGPEVGPPDPPFPWDVEWVERDNRYVLYVRREREDIGIHWREAYALSRAYLAMYLPAHPKPNEDYWVPSEVAPVLGEAPPPGTTEIQLVVYCSDLPDVDDE